MGKYGGGGGYEFSYFFQNALFFICAGVLHLNKERRFLDFVKKRAKQLLIPNIAFSLLTITFVILKRILLNDVDNVIIVSLIRDLILLNGVGLGCWFLSALFSVGLIVEIFLKLFKKPILVFIISYLIYLSADLFTFLQFCNIDKVAYQIHYYAFGIVIAPYLLKDKLVYKGRKLIIFIWVLSAIFTILSFFLANTLHDFEKYFIIWKLFVFLRAVIICIAFAGLSYGLQKIRIFSIVGQNTLFLCGNEYIIRAMMNNLLAVSNYTLKPSFVLCAVISFSMLLVGTYIVTPLEKNISGLFINCMHVLKKRIR